MYQISSKCPFRHFLVQFLYGNDLQIHEQILK